MTEKRPTLLIIGHARHGKDTVAEMLRDQYGLTFASSSHFVAERCIWPTWGQERYNSFEEMFEDRVNHRELWSNLINAYNTPDKARTGREMIQELNLDMYVGMRDRGEYEACMAQGVFSTVIWVDGSKRHPDENNPKMTMERSMAHYVIDNNGTLQDLEKNVAELVHKLNTECGFHWRLPEMLETESITLGGRTFTPEPHPTATPVIVPNISEAEEVDMEAMPEGATQVHNLGYVALMDVMGTDDDIAEAARLSYGRGTKKARDNSGLIRYLYSHAHTSPFEMVEMKFQMRLPIFVMRQWVRHRTANLNEYSGRYSVMPRMWYTPQPDDIMIQDTVNKQGSVPGLSRDLQLDASHKIWLASERAFDTYDELLKMGVSREMARIVLPLNTYTEIVWKMDLNNMLKFLWLRDDSHAQPEIQAYARVIAQMVQEKFPMVYTAYKESRESFTLTKHELLALITGDRSALSKSQTKKSEDIQLQLQQWIRAEMTK